MSNSELLQSPGHKLKLKGRQRHAASQGHPWVYANELEAPPSTLQAGQSCALHDSRDRFIGYGLVNPKSNIIWRRYSSHKTESTLGAQELQRALAKSIDLRSEETFCRLVWSDADFLPGLIIDRFGDVAVIQSVTAAMDARLDIVAAILNELLGLKEIVFRCDAPIRSHEGVDKFVRTYSGRPLEPAWYEIDGFQYLLDLQDGQKTGFYLDQRPQHKRVGVLASGKRVLDMCCNQGAFAMHCAQAGATEARAVDISEACITATRKNAENNGLPIETVTANAFDYFSEHKGDSWDVIILDPPSFARNRKAVNGALKGYKELNLRAIQSLEPGGILATYCCSHHVSQSDFLRTISEAAADARRSIRVLEVAGQPADHPILLNFPESQYLKGFILQRI
ncbi:MAG: class I SAM-dependent rRNA methyltransferase [Opitutales bacterium]|nr:class I SAM-dependent rRNA methyltransferase [Opitutales bacterium]NRA26740.1 class I SAM-dependent rRNA methyltransferase [Opitutales bacterium]